MINQGMYGGSFNDHTMKLSLLRTPIYAAFPIKERKIAPEDRFIDHIDMGRREFSFRITTEKKIERAAQIYNEAPLIMSFFPSGNGIKKTSMIKIDHQDIILSGIKKKEKGYVCQYVWRSRCQGW